MSTSRFLYTLPSYFNNTIDQPLNITSTKPQAVIQTLGDFLGINDYERNIASFWFLDALARQVLRCHQHLDPMYLCILVSWLTGELRLMQENRFSRNDFFDEMEAIFMEIDRKIIQGEEIPHWNLIDFAFLEAQLIAEENEQKFSDLSVSKASVLQKDDIISSFKESKASSKNDGSNSEMKSYHSETLRPALALRLIVEATYDMYAGETRYDLVYATFVEDIEVQIYQLPFKLRQPRPVKLDSTDVSNFDLQLWKALQKMERSDNSKGKPKKVDKKMALSEFPFQPPNSLIEEEFLAYKRQFILPLIESKEAAALLKMYT